MIEGFFLVTAVALMRNPSQEPQGPVATALHRWNIEEASHLAFRLPARTDRRLALGIVANRHGRILRSIALIEPLAKRLRPTENLEVQALAALADDYAKLARFDDAGRIARRVLGDDLRSLTEAQQDDLKGFVDAAAALGRSRPTTVSWKGALTARLHPTPIGLPALAQSGTEGTTNWLLDTGASYTTVTETTARKLGIVPHGHPATTGTSTDARLSVQYGIARKLVIEDAVFHDLVIYIVPDAALFIKGPDFTYQMEAILGANAFMAMRRVGFIGTDRFVAGTAVPAMRRDAAFSLQGMIPVVMAGIDGHALPFLLDTGANRTVLSANYRKLFAHKLGDAILTTRRVGAGGEGDYRSLRQASVTFTLGGGTASLRDVNVPSRADEVTDAAPDPLYGAIGMNLLGQFNQVAIDYVRMRFAAVGRNSTPVGLPRR